MIVYIKLYISVSCRYTSEFCFGRQNIFDHESENREEGKKKKKYNIYRNCNKY